MKTQERAQKKCVCILATQMKNLHLKKQPKLFSSKYKIKNTQKKISILFQQELNRKLNKLQSDNLIRYFKSIQDIEDLEIKAPQSSPQHYD